MSVISVPARKIAMKCLAASFILISGCRDHRVLNYSWGTIVSADSNAVNQKCSATDGFWDDGRVKYRGESVGGCTVKNGRGGKPEFWIVDDDYGWRCALPHELAHGDGVADPEIDGYGCRR